MFDMPIHLRGTYRQMHFHFLALVHLLLILWMLFTAKRLILINNLLPTPIRPVLFVNRKNHAQMLVWELLIYIFLQLVRYFLLCWRALGQFELGDMEKLCAYIERKIPPKLEPSTTALHPIETL